MSDSLKIRLAASGVHIELQMPSSRWLSVPMDQHLPTRLGMILRENGAKVKPKLAQTGNPTAHAILKGWDLPKVEKKFDTKGFFKGSLDDLIS